jgi:nitroreductase
MQRRDFIRLIGDGLLVSAGLGQAGCVMAKVSSTEAWLGPPATQDNRLRWLGYALLAPNPHNRQPWLVDLRQHADELTLYVDRQRLLPATDPFSRQIVIGHGTFIEQLVMAAGADGFATEVVLFPEGEFSATEVDDRPLATLAFRRYEQSLNDPLFGAILQRRTSRLPFDLQRPVPSDKLDAIVSAAQRPGIAVGATLDAAQVKRLRSRAAAAWVAEQQTDTAVMETLRLLRVGQQEIEAHRDGLTVTGFVPEIASAIGLFRRDVVPAPGSMAAERMRDSVVSLANSAMGWVWLVTRGNSRRQQVEAGRAYVRMQLAATLAGIALHPMSQALQEYPQMREQFQGLHQDLGTDPQTEIIQMLARIGYAESTPPTPRRKLSDLIRSAT